MKRWAWVWLAGLALLGWAPALLLSYFIAVALALASGWQGVPLLGVAYYSILAVGLLLLVQVRKFFGLTGAERAWFTSAGGGALVLVWVGAYLIVGSLV